MAYQVLARKYRPQRFADVVGQGHVTVTLMNALRQGRIAHGYIFSGHRGIGKTTIARILAMALNCRNAIGSEARPSPEPCEVCESCTEIRAGNAVDVIEIDAATNRGIDEIRELRDAARYRPARDRYKIYILDEAHQITDAAFNALLKTLEEPPEHIVFMMATTQPEDIPQTVRSRCQHFNFHAVKMVDILSELRGIAEREGVDADEGALALLAEAGDGSMRDALSVMDQAIASAPLEDGRAVLSSAQIRELMGTVSNAIFERLLEAVDAGRSAEVITLANELMDAGNSPAQLARQCLRFLRNVLMAKISGVSVDAGLGGAGDGVAAELLQVSPDEQRRAARAAARFTEEELTRFMQVMLRTFDELGYRQEQRFHFELGLLKLVHLRRLLPVEELLSALPARSATAPAATDRVATDRGVAARGPAGAARPDVGGSVAAPVRTGGAPISSGLPAAGVAPASSATARVADTKPAFSPFAVDSQRKRFPEPAGAGAVKAERSVPGSVPYQLAAIPPVETPGVLPSASVAGAEAEVVREELPRAAVPIGEPDAAASATRVDQPAAATAESSRPVLLEALEAPAEADDARATPIDAGEPAPPERGGAGLDDAVGKMRQAAIAALLGSAKQSSAGEALEDAEWSLANGVLRVQTGFSKAMLAMVLNPEAERIARAAIREAGGDGVKVEWLTGGKRESKPAVKRAARSGSAQAKAEEHPMVRQAQQLFDAEIRNVIDLSEGK